MAISRITPTGVTLTLESMPEPTNKYEVAATLVVDRISELSPRPEDRSFISLGELQRAIEKMLAEGSLHVTVQYA